MGQITQDLLQSQMKLKRKNGKLKQSKIIIRLKVVKTKAERRFRSSHESTCPEPAFDL